MVSKVVITRRAQEQLDDYVLYVLLEKGNAQAAGSILDDAERTKASLLNVAESLRYCEDEDLKALGYRKILFMSHDYLFIYRVIGSTAYVDATYHQLQDYENLFRTEVF